MEKIHSLQNPSAKWWLEKELFWLVFLVVLASFIRLDHVPLRGEETRRGLIASEMIRLGDWIVPREQEIPSLSRPPLQYWCIALLSLIAGECNVWAIRLPSALATLALTIFLYDYARSQLPRLGAFATAAAYPTMLEVLKLSSEGETESLFTLFVAASLLTWHWGWSRNWPEKTMWIASCALAALATLTKGIQAPLYFFGAILVFLLLQKQWRRLFSKSFATGVLTYVILVGIWLLPFTWQTGWDGVHAVFGKQASQRILQSNWQRFAVHLVVYPLNIFACTLPWSVLLLFFARRSFRESVQGNRPQILFLLSCVVVSFPTVWLTPLAVTRYWMPMYPCLCLLIGLVVQKCANASADSMVRVRWNWFIVFWCFVLAFLPPVALGGDAIELITGKRLSQPPLAAAGFALAVTALVLLAFRLRKQFEAENMKLAFFGLALCLALIHAIVHINVLLNYAVPAEEEVVQVQRRIGNRELFSFGKIHHRFAFHYKTPIARLPWPENEEELPPDLVYFCFSVQEADGLVPFRWQRIADIVCDSHDRPTPYDRVIVGKRIIRSSSEDYK